MVYFGAFAMFIIGKKLKKRYNLSEDVRRDIYEACDVWTDELKKKKSTFIGGDTPNLADLALFGALMSMEGCQAYSDILTNTDIESWINAIKMHVCRNKGDSVIIQR